METGAAVVMRHSVWLAGWYYVLGLKRNLKRNTPEATGSGQDCFKQVKRQASELLWQSVQALDCE